MTEKGTAGHPSDRLAGPSCCWLLFVVVVIDVVVFVCCGYCFYACRLGRVLGIAAFYAPRLSNNPILSRQAFAL